MNFSDILFTILSYSKDTILFLAMLAIICFTLMLLSGGIPTGL